ncbi:hypothetical protein T484DRAFT_1620078, partial [Baffinella frigidus]
KTLKQVFRLTLVKGKNCDEIDGYADLVARGKPHFIEVKGVTFCGETSKAADIKMSHVPWHHEVLNFAKDLVERVNRASGSSEPEYEVAGVRARTFVLRSDRVDQVRPKVDSPDFPRRFVSHGLSTYGNTVHLCEYEVACAHEHSCCVLIASTRYKTDGKWQTFIDYDKFHEGFRKWQADGTPLDVRNPQPSTLHPQPSTLNPQPSTLNPQPSTLNPRPSTLNPTP